VRSFYEEEEGGAKITPEPKPEINQPLSDYSPNKVDRVAKFQERQAKALQSQKETK
jgi:hypothetical protein